MQILNQYLLYSYLLRFWTRKNALINQTQKKMQILKSLAAWDSEWEETRDQKPIFNFKNQNQNRVKNICKFSNPYLTVCFRSEDLQREIEEAEEKRDKHAMDKLREELDATENDLLEKSEERMRQR